MGIRCFAACFLLLVVAIDNCAAQGSHEPVSNYYRYRNVFTPAAYTIFSDDFTQLKNGDLAGNKWQQAQGVMGAIDAVNSLNKNGFGDRKAEAFSIYGIMKPDIAPGVVTGKYVTFECDFMLVDTNAKLVIDLPDEEGVKHLFTINKLLWAQYLRGSESDAGAYKGKVSHDSRSPRFDPTQWHCLAVSFSGDNMSFFLDSYFLWGLGDGSNVIEGSEYKGAYDAQYRGKKPATFSISQGTAAGWIALRSVRFAQSDEVPKPQRVQVPEFNKILSGEKFVTQDIHFAVNKAEIKSESLPYIDALATWLKQNPLIKLEITGHTDSDGDEAANMVLSQKRADAIVSKLVSTGIATERLKGVGYGEAKPVRGNDTEAGKAANRRVEFQKM